MTIVATGAMLLVFWWLLLLIHAVFKRYRQERKIRRKPSFY